MDEKYMKLAIELAKKGKGQVNPNPLVGAVIVKENRIIGQGYHEKYGHFHAEVNAFNNVSESPIGSTLYVTLEPCSHYGKTPPCVDKIIENQISKVVIGCLDPNPLVSGRGVKKLQEAGIEVVTGVLETECRRLNEVFMNYIVNQTPFVVLKTAMTLDGKIATVTGESQWISGESSRKQVHQLRHEMSAIMVGIETVIHDDPLLTCRLEGGRHPIRIIVDSQLRIPLQAKVITNQEAKTIIATTELASDAKINVLKEQGIDVLIIPIKNSRVDLEQLMIELGKLGIDGILLEGGSTLNFSALEASIVDKVQFYIAPKLLGGQTSKTPIEGNGISSLADVIKVEEMSVQIIGEDVLIEGYVN